MDGEGRRVLVVSETLNWVPVGRWRVSNGQALMPDTGVLETMKLGLEASRITFPGLGSCVPLEVTDGPCLFSQCFEYYRTHNRRSGV